MKQNYKITAVITTYKRSWELIERAVNSVLNQTYPVEEILLVDDNNADSPYSESICREAEKQARVRYIPMVKNSGVAAARNRGIAEANGDLIGFLDDDDEWHPDKLETLVRLFEKYPDLGLAFGMAWIHHANGQEEYTWQKEIYKESPSYADMLWNDYVGSASIPLLRVDAVRQVGGFLTENQPAEEDYELWLRISRQYPIRGVENIVIEKYMGQEEHISRNLKRVFFGFRNIYRVNREAYKKNPRSQVGILWNISRCGVRAFDIRVVPYVFKWFALKVYCKCVLPPQ